MIQAVEIERLFPRFLLNDRNGYAMAKAIAAGLEYFLEKCQEGLDTVLDVEKMPEWRLDECAKEYNIPFDYTAETEQKRAWVRSAVPMYQILGTKKAVRQFLEGYFGEIEVEENWQYAGEPFHFRVTVGGEWTPENEAWAREAIRRTKPARSVLDDLSPGTGFTILVKAEVEWWRFRYPVTGNYSAGTWPRIVKEGIIDAGGATISAPADAYQFPFPRAGTRPRSVKEGVIDAGGATISAPADAYKFPFPRAGTKPETVKTGETESGAAFVNAEESTYAIPYVVCGGDRLF